MHNSGSILKTVIERVRGYMDEPSSKWTNDYLIRYIIMPEMTNVISRMALSADNLILQRYSIDVVPETEYYQLPACVGEIYRVCQYDQSNQIKQDYRMEGEYAPRGPGWRIEGNVLAFRPKPLATDSWDVHYTSNGDFFPHYCTTGTLVAVDGNISRLTLGTVTPANGDLGEVDRRPNAYGGAVLRVLADSGVREERIISVHDPSDASPYVDVRIPFLHQTAGTIKYEITPPGTATMVQAISASAAMNLGVSMNMSEKMHSFLRIEYRKGKKTAGDTIANMNQRKPKGWDRKTIDNQADRMWYLS